VAQFPIQVAGGVVAVGGFLTSIAKWQYDIWMIEGFDQQPMNWWSRLWRR
jgi:hypothetical protein